MIFVTDFADQAVMLPLAAIVAAYLGVAGRSRMALAWLAVVGCVFGLVLVAKSSFVLLAATYGSDYTISPSGHVASAGVVYGGLAVLLCRGVLPTGIIAAIAAAIILVVGYSRVALSMHSVGEVVAGGIVASLGVAALAVAVGPRPDRPGWPLALASGGAAMALHGMHLPAEAAIRYAALTW